jgi:single-stranded DNA-binding protein
MANKTIVGRVGREPELSITPTKKRLARYSVAVTVWNPETKKEEPEWYEISAFDTDAVIAAGNGDDVQPQISKGMRVYVSGKYSEYGGTKGIIKQIAVREQGSVDRFFPAEAGDAW